VADDTWFRVLPGDLAKKHDTGGLFAVPLEGPELEDARTRASAGQISATGPMFGASMRSPAGAVQELETDVLAASGLQLEQLAAFRHAGEGTRRALRLLAEDLHWEVTGNSSIHLGFALPKGGYATTLLEHVCQLVEGQTEAPPEMIGDESRSQIEIQAAESGDLGSDDHEGSTFPQ